MKDTLYKRLPAPTLQGQAESDQDGHPGKVKREGAAAEPKKGCGLK